MLLGSRLPQRWLLRRLLFLFLLFVHPHHSAHRPLPLAIFARWIAAAPSPEDVARPHTNEAAENRQPGAGAIRRRGDPGESADVEEQNQRCRQRISHDPGDCPVERLSQTPGLPPAEKIDEWNEQPHCLSTPIHVQYSESLLSVSCRNRTEYRLRHPRFDRNGEGSQSAFPVSSLISQRRASGDQMIILITQRHGLADNFAQQERLPQPVA